MQSYFSLFAAIAIFPLCANDTKFLLKSAPTVETLDLSKISGNTLSERVNSAYQEIVRGIEPVVEEDPRVSVPSVPYQFDGGPSIEYRARPSQTRFVEAALFYKLSKDSSSMNALKKELHALSRQTKKSLPLMARAECKAAFLGAYALTAGIAVGAMLCGILAIHDGLLKVAACAGALCAVTSYGAYCFFEPALEMLLFFPHYGLEQGSEATRTWLLLGRMSRSVEKFSRGASTIRIDDTEMLIEAPLFTRKQMNISFS